MSYNPPMAALRTLILTLVIFLFAGCSAPLLPPASAPYPSRQNQSDADLMTRLRLNWELLEKTHLPEKERAIALRDYNSDLLLLLRRLRYDSEKEGKPVRLKDFDIRHQLGDESLRLMSVYDDMVPAADVPLQSLRERYMVHGLGVPLVGVIPASKISNAPEKRFNIATRGTVTSITCILRFPKRGKPSLVLIPRMNVDFFRVGRLNYQLAADWSAPLEVYWNLTHVQDDRILGLLRPQELRDTTGLSSIEPYNPNKIPVILAHGLASSANTFDNFVNRLMAYPEIRKNYQFWYFNYPSGIAWTISARVYRESIRKLRDTVDPMHQNSNWNNMVVVGHSMGGLITHYSQCTDPWNILLGSDIPHDRLKPYLNAEYIDKPFSDPAMEKLRHDYYFHPIKAGLVVYMATPHRGAPVAKYRLVTALAKLVALPQTLIREAYNLATLQRDMLLLNPQDAYLWFTSVGQLKPDSYSIKGLQELTVRNAPTHSVIGDRGYNYCPECSDGIVPYWSSHISWGTQTIVPYDHSVQDGPETALDMRKVLGEYAAKHPAIIVKEP